MNRLIAALIFTLAMCAPFQSFSIQQNPDAPIVEVAPALDQVEVLNRPANQAWWMFLFAVLILAFVGLLRNLNSQRHKFTFQSFFISPKAENELVEDNYHIDIYQVLQIALSCLTIGWMISLLNPFDLNFTMVGEFGQFLLIILLVLLVYSLKYFLHFIIGIILQSERLSKVMVFSQSNMMYAIGLILFPLILFYAFSRDVTLQNILKIGCFSLFGLMLIMRFIKTFRIYLYLFPYRRVYIFIYLCALEILPLLMLSTYISLEWI